MSKSKLQDVILWKDANKISDYCYGLLDNFPEEEKWLLGLKIRTRAFETTSNIAEAYGSIDPRDAIWHLGMARRDFFGLNNALRMSAKRGYIKVDPNIMLSIDKAVEGIDQEITRLKSQISVWFAMHLPKEKGKK